jgi:hypothetical protein
VRTLRAGEMMLMDGEIVAGLDHERAAAGRGIPAAG